MFQGTFVILEQAKIALINKESKTNMGKNKNNSDEESNNSKRKYSDPNYQHEISSPINFEDKRPRIFTDDHHSPLSFKDFKTK